MPQTRPIAQHAKSEPNLNINNENVKRPERSHFSSPAAFFSNQPRRPRRNIGYIKLAFK